MLNTLSLGRLLLKRYLGSTVSPTTPQLLVRIFYGRRGSALCLLTRFAAIYDYEQKYPPDPLWHELGENARVWHVYNDEAKIVDKELQEVNGDSLDILLIYVSLSFRAPSV